MDEAKQPKQPTTASADKLAQPGAKTGIELSEAALDQASGGALNAYLKLDTGLKLDGIKGESSLNFTTPSVPAVQKP